MCFRVEKEDEMQCLIKGFIFLLRNIPDEAFLYERHGESEYSFVKQELDTMFPFMIVNIGSGVSILKVSIGL